MPTPAAGCAGVLAATGQRRGKAKRLQYASVAAFVEARGQPWSGLGLAPFKATARAGVLEWLQWLVDHTPSDLPRVLSALES